jgi:YVTN family beta-propeller protein
MERLTRQSLPLTMLLGAAVALSPALAQHAGGAGPRPAASSRTAESGGGPQRVVTEGIQVEFTIEPLAPGDKASVTAGEVAVVRFRVSDTASGAPLSGVRPAAWVSRRETPNPPDAAQCRKGIESLVQGSLRARPDVDLNAYYILALNQEANISVIDPLLEFGGSKLLNLVALKSPGEDWALTSDQARLFVSMPQSGQVAVVDTRTWKAVATVETGGRPRRLALQPDEHYLWVGNDAPGVRGGVAAIDTAELKIAAHIPTGGGHHEIAFSADNRFAFVTNRDDGTLTVIDVRNLARLKDIKTGTRATALALSPSSKAAYVVDDADGSIGVVDGGSHRIVTRMTAKPGLSGIRFAPGGRWGFATNPAESSVHILDASTNRIVHTVAVGKGPEGVSFTRAFAYVRSAGTEEVTAIRLSTIGGELDIVKFPGGQLAPGASRTAAATADAIVPAPEGNTVLVANPADRMIYYFSEGMAAPMGNFQNYRREPRAVMVVDRSLRETLPGVYATNVTLPKTGTYTVSFLLDVPRILHCFEVRAEANSALPEEKRSALRVEYLDDGKRLRAGQTYTLRFRLLDTSAGQPASDVKDVRVLVFLAPGIWQHRELARSVGGGVYELDLTVPQPGVYMVFVESPSLGVTFKQLPYVTLQADAEPGAPGN